MNSNHDMYSSGGPYFNEVVGGPIFNKLQSPYSFFALENAHWIIVGLDSAYFSSALTLYLDGTLGINNAQTAFLREIANRGKKVILLTHHNGIPVGGFDRASDKPLHLYTDVMNAFAGHPPPAYWYYGHEHFGAAYNPLNQTGILCRCLGHGALPWGFASALQTADNNGAVAWFEQRNAADPDNKLRVYNGFVCLELNGPDFTETFYDETGGIAWQCQQSALGIARPNSRAIYRVVMERPQCTPHNCVLRPLHAIFPSPHPADLPHRACRLVLVRVEPGSDNLGTPADGHEHHS